MNRFINRIGLTGRRISYLCFLPFVCASVSSQQQSAHSNDFDHLIPVDGIIEPAYEALLAKRLFVGSTDILRIITIPPSASGETGIAIQNRTDGSGNIFVSWTQAKKNLWSAAVDKNRNIVRNPAIDTNRLEVSVPKSVATAIVESIKRVLQRVRPPTKTERVILDGTMIEISISDQKGQTTRGLLDENAHGKNITALRRVVQLLEAYCHAKPAARSELLKELESVSEEF
jgi:hypothetical protein